MSDKIENEQDYSSKLERKAKIAVDEWKNYKEDYDNMNEYVWELVDSDQWIIYTGYALDVIQYSPTSLRDTEWQVYVNLDNADANDIFQAMAFTLLERDLYNKIQELLEGNNE